MPTTWRPVALGALAVGIALGGLLVPRSEPLRPDCPPAPLSEDVTTDWLSRAGGALAVPVPPKRLERQQAPPCVPPPGEQEEINGGCWSEMRMKPPCGQFYEHAGKCYVPVRETPRPPTSVQP
ncbi:hypothetical protein [Melittangium boletus]|uniref:hypothetical protein n=1 Tax=Melittangium boletus TaxID=83453 RepID=UPI003DA3873B